MQKWCRRHGYFLLQLFCIAVILIMTLINWGKLGVITIIDDEFGYWGAGAQFAGLHWESLLSESNYYAYGYGLLLAPLFKLGISPGAMFKAAAAGNIVMLLASFEIAVYVGRTLFPKEKKSFLAAAALTVTLFANNIFQVHIGAAETLLYVLFWFITMCLTNMLVKRRKRDIIGLVCAAVYIYAAHNRSVGVVLVVFLAMLTAAWIWRRQRYGKYLLSGLILFVLLFIFAEYVREFTISQWYQNNQGVAVNDYSGQINTIKSIFSAKGIMIFGLSVVGKLFSQGVGGFCLSFLIITSFLGQAMKSLRLKKINWTPPQLLTCFLMLCYLAEILITAIHKNRSPGELIAGRIMMGRYIDFVVGPVLMLAICRLKNREVQKWEMLLCTAVFTVCMVLTMLQLRIAGGSDIIYYNNMDIAIYTKLLPGGSMRVLLMGIISIAVFWIFYQVFLSGACAGIIAVLLLTGGFWGISGVTIASGYLDTKNTKQQKYVYSVYDIVKEYDESTAIYWVKGEGDSDTKMEYFKVLQFLEPKRKIEVVTLEILEKQPPEGAYLVMSGTSEEVIAKIEKTFRMKINSGRLCLYEQIAE